MGERTAPSSGPFLRLESLGEPAAAFCDGGACSVPGSETGVDHEPAGTPGSEPVPTQSEPPQY